MVAGLAGLPGMKGLYQPVRCVKIGGDKGGGTFKMSFQIVNIDTPNAVHNTCVFSCFAADDSVTNFHVALDRFKEQIEHMHGMKWR